MFKSLFTSVLAILISLPVFSQSIKVHGGMNISAITAVSGGSATGQAGFQVGVSAQFGDHFYLEPGFFYMRRLTEISKPGFEPDLELNGFHIPLSAGYYLIGRNDGPVTLRIFGGPSVFLVNDSEGTLNDNDINQTQWNVFAGAGADFLFLFLEAKYEWSLTRISDSQSFGSGMYTTFFLNGGVRFSL